MYKHSVRCFRRPRGSSHIADILLKGLGFAKSSDCLLKAQPHVPRSIASVMGFFGKSPALRDSWNTTSIQFAHSSLQYDISNWAVTPC